MGAVMGKSWKRQRGDQRALWVQQQAHADIFAACWRECHTAPRGSRVRFQPAADSSDIPARTQADKVHDA
eukprot:364197-Chlamydomonas_euryale.AAC.10